MLSAVKNYFIGGDGSSQVSSNSSIATVVAELKQLVVGLREEMKDIKLQLSNVGSRISAPYQDVTSLGPLEELEKADHSYFIMRSGLNDYAGPIPFSLFGGQDIDALNASLRVFSDKVYHDNVYIVPYILEVQDIESGDLGIRPQSTTKIFLLGFLSLLPTLLYLFRTPPTWDWSTLKNEK